jgi:DNA polymerase V
VGEPPPLALIDGNNFYVSCERAFDRKLEGVPVLVLSNNDGCAIARSEEMKALDVRMGEPAFKLRPLRICQEFRVWAGG